MALDRLSETMTYVMWHEERLWNVSILQRVHFSGLVPIVVRQIYICPHLLKLFILQETQIELGQSCHSNSRYLLQLKCLSLHGKFSKNYKIYNLVMYSQCCSCIGTHRYAVPVKIKTLLDRTSKKILSVRRTSKKSKHCLTQFLYLQQNVEGRSVL
jgi:hypothetical protein